MFAEPVGDTRGDSEQDDVQALLQHRRTGAGAGAATQQQPRGGRLAPLRPITPHPAAGMGVGMGVVKSAVAGVQLGSSRGAAGDEDDEF